MKHISIGKLILMVIFIGAMVCLSGFPVWAGDAQPHWRPTYDKVMLWVNFLILVTVIVKYGRMPIKKFLESQKEDVQSEIKQLEQEKAAIQSKVADAVTEAEKSQTRLEQIKVRIKAQGEKKRDQIITDANRQSTLLIEDAKRKIDYRIRQARLELKSEVVDMAIAQATKQLPNVITKADDQALVEQYLEKADT